MKNDRLSVKARQQVTVIDIAEDGKLFVSVQGGQQANLPLLSQPTQPSQNETITKQMSLLFNPIAGARLVADWSPMPQSS